MNVADQSESSLLIATKPAEPVQHPSDTRSSHASLHRKRHTPAKRDPLGRPGHPVRHRRVADGVVEARHAGKRDPTVLAEPAVRAAGAGARAIPAVGSALIRVGVRVAGEHGGGAVRVREGEDRGEHVSVVGRGRLQGPGVLKVGTSRAAV